MRKALILAAVFALAQAQVPAPVGGDMSNTTATGTGSTTARKLADRFADFGVSVLDTGAKCDGTTDDTANIQAAINTASSKFGTVLFPAGKTCKISATLTITVSGVKLQCLGGTTVGASVAQCDLLWAGGASPMVSITAPTSTPIYYNGISNLTLDGNAAATIDLYINGAQQGTLENVHLRQATTWALQSDTNGTLPVNTQGWYVNNLFIDGATASMGGVDLKCNDAGGLVYCSAFWTFINPQISTGTAGGTGILFDGGSNNNILGGRVFGTAGNSIVLRRYVGATGNQSAIGNMIVNTFTQKPLLSTGTVTDPACTPYGGTGISTSTTCPYHNFFRLNTLSGGVAPVVEAGSQLNYQSDLNNLTTQQVFMGDAQYPGLVISNVLAGLGQCLNDALAAGASTGSWQCSTGANAMETWDHGPNQDIWKWAFTGSAGARDLHLTPTTGTGNMRVDTGFVTKSYTVATLPACSGPLAGLLLTVSDQTASPVYNAAPTGGGALVMPVQCGGGTWHLH